MLSVEEFAKISAEIAAGTPRDKVLARAGVPTAAWLESQKHYLAKMAGEAGAAERATSSRYWAVFTARRRELELERSAQASSRPSPRGVAAEPGKSREALSELPAPALSVAPATLPERPSFFEIDDEATATMDGSSNLFGAEAGQTPLPFVPGEASLPSAAPPTQAGEGSSRSGTLAVIPRQTEGASTLPFPRGPGEVHPAERWEGAPPGSGPLSLLSALASMPAPQARPATSATSATSAPALRLRLDQFSALMARLIAEPEKSAQTCAAHGLDPAQTQAESHAWLVRCCQDWQLLSHLYASVQRELGRLRGEQPGGS